jgi:hypothetical protein
MNEATTSRINIMRLTETHLRLLVILIALHSTIVGAMLFLAPQWTMRFAGWGSIQPEFFALQAGIFHFVLAAAYLIEYSRYGGVLTLVTAKTIAFAFLTGATLLDPLPWAVWVSGLLDGAMAVVVVLVQRWVVSSSADSAIR